MTRCTASGAPRAGRLLPSSLMLAVLLSPAAAGRLVDVGVDRGHRGRPKASDHAPVWVDLKA